MDLEKCKIKIVKIGENNVEKQYILFTETGEEIVMETESYGTHKVEEERKALEAKQAEINAFNKTKSLSEIQTKLNLLNEIETKL